MVKNITLCSLHTKYCWCFLGQRVSHDGMLATFVLSVWMYSCHGQIRLAQTQTATFEDNRVACIPGTGFPFLCQVVPLSYAVLA